MTHLNAIFLTILLHTVLIFFNPSQLSRSTLPVQIPEILPIRVSFYQEPAPLMLTSSTAKKAIVPVKKVPKLTRLPGDRKQPVVESKQLPTYPKFALNHNLQGKIIVQASINIMGRITKILILKSTGHVSLDESFLYTLKHHYLFKPKRVMGKNRPSVIKLSHEFRI